MGFWFVVSSFKKKQTMKTLGERSTDKRLLEIYLGIHINGTSISPVIETEKTIFSSGIQEKHL